MRGGGEARLPGRGSWAWLAALFLSLAPAAPAPAESPVRTAAASTPVVASQAVRTPQPPPGDHPALWVVRDADTTIYIFGTFHFLGTGRDWLAGAVRGAFESSDELVLEALLPDDPAQMQSIIFRYAVDPLGRPLSHRIPEAQWQRVRRALGTRLADAMDEAHLEPWLFGLSIANRTAQRIGLSPQQGADRVLQAEAARRNMPVAALETANSQIAIYDRMSQTAQMRGLFHALEDSEEPGRTLRPLLDTWTHGDVDGLANALDRTIELPEVRRALFSRRNGDWARWIVQRMQRPGTVFLAVGAGHLVGPQSVQAQLGRLGFASARATQADTALAAAGSDIAPSR